VVPVRSHAVMNVQLGGARAVLSVPDPSGRPGFERTKFEQRIGVAHRRNGLHSSRRCSPSSGEAFVTPRYRCRLF
jgi:hypothetical protein